eukprot:scaffold94945_cov42-Phaeocystis_antarctica.AAC.2
MTPAPLENRRGVDAGNPDKSHPSTCGRPTRRLDSLCIETVHRRDTLGPLPPAAEGDTPRGTTIVCNSTHAGQHRAVW